MMRSEPEPDERIACRRGGGGMLAMPHIIGASLGLLSRRRWNEYAGAIGTGHKRTDSLGGIPGDQHCSHTFMNRTISLVLLTVGVILIIYGVSASNSIGSGFSRLFTGMPTDATVWLMVGGVIAAVVGIVGLLSRKS